MTMQDRELIEAWRAVANAKLIEFRRQCWRLAMLVRQGAVGKAAAVDRLYEIAIAHALGVRSGRTASRRSSSRRSRTLTFG
jgi:hypothetical protein